MSSKTEEVGVHSKLEEDDYVPPVYSDTESDSEDDGEPIDIPPPPVRKGRRPTVMAAPLRVEEDWKPPVHPKSEEQKDSIQDSVRGNVLFGSLDDKDIDIIVDAFQEMEFPADHVLIRQGDEGDLFYVLAEGTVEIAVEAVGVVMTLVGGSSGRNSFGELALLYDAPRAATVMATTPVRVWALDRVTFKSILMDATIKRRNLYKGFLESVDLLSSLSSFDRLTIADALKPVTYKAGEDILLEGEEGDDFFLIESGEVKVTKKDVEGEVSRRLSVGDFFGELALLTHDTRQATVTAVERTRCLTLDRYTFTRLLGPLEPELRKRESERFK
eukprot:PLAT2902.1.p1 GENE.PLAT2902.1~~PLAT2902.1.p1  ORF type:complete len:329 (+),score=195.61 PLAT2902.1:65-1051(+)